jgi:hypothetical protein
MVDIPEIEDVFFPFVWFVLMALLGLMMIQIAPAEVGLYTADVGNSSVILEGSLEGDCSSIGGEVGKHLVRINLSAEAYADLDVRKLVALHDGENVYFEELEYGESTEALCLYTGENEVVALNSNGDSVASVVVKISEVSGSSDVLDR